MQKTASQDPSARVEPDSALAIEQIRAAEERYRAISEVVADWAYSLTIHPDGEAVLMWSNMDTPRITGYGPADLDERGWLGLVHPDDRSVIGSHFGALLTRRQAELDRARLISELEATNEELERMAASVSQELEGPLAAVAAGLKRLDTRLEDSDPGLDADVHRAHGAILHLRDMLESLEELARIGHLPETLESVYLGELADEAVDLCCKGVQSRGVDVVVGDLPKVFGDRIRLLQLLRILVENAAGYMGDQSEPRLEIGAESRGGKHVIFVRDNGVGIDPADLERVFDVFRRLDPRSSGTGVGLAMARRIAEMHGGRIRAESEGKGTGSTFFVELPA